MKQNALLYSVLILCTILSSCATSYKYVQVCEVKTIDNATPVQETDNGLLYENDNCIVTYNIYSNGGDAGFTFYNKSDAIIHIDLSQTFFIKNGVANDYYIPQIQSSETNTSSSAIADPAASNTALWMAALFGNVALINTAQQSYTTSTITTPQPILSIPPRSARIVSCYKISGNSFDDCELNKYPSDSASLSFDEYSSPLVFTNYITYTIGDSQENNIIENKFYIAKITNYAEPYITKYRPRAKACKNVLTPEQQKYQKNAPQLYDAYYNVSTGNNFYTTYSIYSHSQLYKSPKSAQSFIWVPQYGCYIFKAENVNSYGVGSYPSYLED